VGKCGLLFTPTEIKSYNHYRSTSSHPKTAGAHPNTIHAQGNGQPRPGTKGRKGGIGLRSKEKTSGKKKKSAATKAITGEGDKNVLRKVKNRGGFGGPVTRRR